MSTDNATSVNVSHNGHTLKKLFYFDIDIVAAACESTLYFIEMMS